MGELFIFPRPSQQHFLGRSTEESSLQAFDYIGAGEGNRTLDIQLGKLGVSQQRPRDSSKNEQTSPYRHQWVAGDLQNWRRAITGIPGRCFEWA
jgi:hypothetical protein